MRTVRAKLGVALLALTLGAAACGSQDGETEAGAPSPIAEFLGQDDYFGDDAESQAKWAEQEREREDKIAACMKEQGFEYIPRDNSDFNFTNSPDGIDYDSREYVEKYGFGITTQWYPQSEVGPDLVGNLYEDEFEEQEENDPNQAIMEALDDSTREAYQAALWGDPDDFPTFDPETMTEEELEEASASFDATPQGCEGEAWADDFNNAFYQEFGDELNDLYESIEDDPRIAASQQEINECVADKGYDFDAGFSGYEKLFEMFQEDLQRIDEMVGSSFEVGFEEQDFETMTEEEIDAIYNQPREFTDEAKALLAEIQAEEIEMALVAYDCGGGNNADGELFQEIAAEYEQRFLDENADKLSPYKADK